MEVPAPVGPLLYWNTSEFTLGWSLCICVYRANTWSFSSGAQSPLISPWYVCVYAEFMLARFSRVPLLPGVPGRLGAGRVPATFNAVALRPLMQGSTPIF